ncbi:hypothetical protein LJR143_001682 [Pseudoxanthomonas sp. LjRoot143]|uniref:hypothetical protein n=1 Tax=Pseudoxanthomonas sp. LjRoot143 TaxID=3342266 RepID=UPI003ECEC879
MGVILRANGVSFEANPVGFVPPVPDGLEYWNYLGVDATTSARNLAPGKAPGAVVGDPVFAGGYATLNPLGFIQTQALQSADLTLVAAFRLTAEVSAQVMSNNSSARKAPLTGSTFGASLWTQAGTLGDNNVGISFNQNQFDGTSAHNGQTTLIASLSNQAINTWRCVAGIHTDSTNQSVVRNLSNGTSATVTASAPNTIPDIGAGPFRIGYGNNSGLGTGASDIAFAAVYSRALALAELQAVYDHAKAYLAKRGISI